MSSYARRTNLIEGIGNEVLVGLGALLGGLVGFLIFINQSRRRQGIHPDSYANVASTREMLSPRANQRNTGELTCPICLGTAALAVETNCGHVYCGRCIVTYWQHQSYLLPVRCPSCRTQVSLLLLNFTSQEHAEETDDRREIIDKVNQYNRRFSGAPRSFQEYLQDLPTLLRYAFHEFFSLGGLMWMFRFRIGILVLAAFLYLISPLDILPEGALGLVGFLDDIFIILLAAIYISIIYRQYVASRGA
ncbi:hypothetical protein BsWGS_02436 [Bradybaena similaris]